MLKILFNYDRDRDYSFLKDFKVIDAYLLENTNVVFSQLLFNLLKDNKEEVYITDTNTILLNDEQLKDLRCFDFVEIAKYSFYAKGEAVLLYDYKLNDLFAQELQDLYLKVNSYSKGKVNDGVAISKGNRDIFLNEKQDQLMLEKYLAIKDSILTNAKYDCKNEKAMFLLELWNINTHINNVLIESLINRYFTLDLPKYLSTNKKFDGCIASISRILNNSNYCFHKLEHTTMNELM